MPNTLPRELEFIHQFRMTNSSLDNPQWRTNDFDAEVWSCMFGTIARTIDFRKIIDDGSLLTDPKNRKLLNSIRRFLCLQTHPSATGSTTTSWTTQLMRVTLATHIIDHYLLESAYYQLSKHGFDLVTADDIMALIETISAHRSIKASIYNPVTRIAQFFSTIDLSTEDINKTKDEYPDLFEIDEGAIDLVIPVKQIAKARTWLKLHGCYHFPAAGHTEFKYQVNRRKLLKHIIGNRTLASQKYDGLALEGLDIGPKERYHRELPGVAVNTADDDDRASEEFVSSYVSALKSMASARKFGVSLVSDQALASLENTKLIHDGRMKERSRFTTLPFEVANKVFSKAIEFFIEYGDELVEYYIALAKQGNDIRNLSVPIPKKLQKLGIKTWRDSAKTHQDFFSQLRAGNSLYNMLEVLFGAVAILVNTLMARRMSELLGLTSESIVEDDGLYFLAFDLRKANVGEHRERALRPLPAIGAEALKVLNKLSTSLRKLGYETSKGLFQFPVNAWHNNPPHYGTCASDSPDLNRFLDRFCDYFQVPTDELGRRYYVRTHQLRRNFAMLFFWQGSFGGIEVLRHFLGHKKPSMTYHYVTESIKGKTLMRVKATVAKELIKSDHVATESLAQLICQRYGLTMNDLHILPENDVVDYVEDLLRSGEAEIEPEFVNGPNGEEYRVIYQVVDKPVCRKGS